MGKRINAFINFLQPKNNFKIDPKIGEKLDDLLYQEEVLGERRINRINLVIYLFGLFLTVVIAFFTKFSPMNIPNFLGSCSYLIYYSIMFFFLRKNIYKPFFKYMTMTYNTTVLFAVITAYAYTSYGWLYSLRSVSLISAFIAIIMSGFYQRPKVVIYVTFLAVFEYSLMVLYAVYTHKINLTSEETFLHPYYSIDILVTYDLMFIFAGLLTAFTCSQLKNLLSRTLHTEAEKYNVEKAKEEIEITSRIKTNLFINLSHETKTPLTLISNYLDKYIKQYGLNDDLHIIRQNIDKLTQDMVNFMDIEKLERGRIFYNHSQIFNLSEMLNKKIPFLKTLAEKKNIGFISDVEDSLFVQADPLSVDRIINNLIDNAVKFTSSEGKINLTLDSDPVNIVLTVSDNGIGIPDEEKINIFQPYYQITHAKRNIQGSGMGLYIIKKILESLEGKMELDSRPGCGSTFRVTIKKHILKEDDAVQDNIEFTVPVDRIPVNTKLKDSTIKEDRRNIFVIEDNIDMLQYLQMNLENEYNVFLAVNGREALDKLPAVPKPDIIVSDIMMDDMDGYRFFETLMQIKGDDGRGIYTDTPFIFLTAIQSQEEKLKGLAKGAADFINKPFMMDELKAKIKNFIGIKDAQRESNIEEFENRISRIIREKPPANQEKQTDAADVLKKYNITPREKEIIDCIIGGLDNNEIGEKLFISQNTVKRHIQNIYEKCGIENKIELFNLMKNNR